MSFSPNAGWCSRLGRQLLVLSCCALTFTPALVNAAPARDITIKHAVVAEIGHLRAKPDSNKFELSVSSSRAAHRFELEENKNLFKGLDADMSNGELVLYKGKLKDHPRSWVRLSYIDGGYSGAFFDGEDLYFIEQGSNVKDALTNHNLLDRLAQKGRRDVIFKASDIEHHGLCGMEGPAHFSDSSFDYQHYVQDLNELAATAPSKELELAVVADTQFNMAYAGNGLEKMLAEMNIVDGIFSEQVGVQLKIVQSHVMSDDGYLTATNASTLIQDFRNYVHSEIGNPGLTHLFTGRNLDGSTVGIAYLSAMCSSYGVGITQKYGSMTALIAAHEIGHNFGAPHDNQSGSACATTGGTFLMNPMVNGNDQFSTCSLQQMNSRIQNAYCLNELDGLAPVISSTAGNSARVGLAYAYDADERIDVSGGTGLSYRLDFGPDGMIIEADGRIVWTPTAAQEGTQVAQITVSNAFGSDSQYFEIEVASAPAPAGDVIDFSQFYLGSYGGTQDKTGPVSIEDQGKTLRMQGNRWKYIDYPYVVTANTVLEFDFSSSKEGEIHAIGMDTDGQLRQKRILQLYGTQPYGKMLSRYNGKGQSQHYVVPVGLYYQGNMKTLFFGMDHDVSNPTGESVFSNVRVYEQSSEQLSFNFNDTEILSYAGGQDKTGSVHILEDGNVLRLQGNLWKAISLYTQIDKDSVLSFDFMSDSKGELHGLGFDNDDKETADKIFTLYGTQRYGNQTYSYTTPGQYQHFEIPVGQFYTGTFNKLFFMMDHDVSNPTGVSYFKNISIH